MAYQVGGDGYSRRNDGDYSRRNDDGYSRRTDDGYRRPERVTYEEERVVRRVSGPRGSVQPYGSSRVANDDWDRPINVKVIEEPKKEPGYFESISKNGGKLLAFGIGVVGFGVFWWGAFSAINGSHPIPGLGRVATPGMAPGAMMIGGTAAMLAGGALNHWLNPKK